MDREKAPGGLRRDELIMGTMIALHLADPLPMPVLEALADEFFAWMRKVDQRFSTFKENSEVCRLRRGEIQLAECSSDLREVLDECTRLWTETDGFFDVYATGALDPSGYVKGWSAEIASQRLANSGCVNHFINAGGDIRTRGCPEPGAQWHIPIRHPWHDDGIFLMLAGNDLAVATSGTYERGFHVVNPHTGQPAHLLRSVTVTGPNLALADAYATAGVAMGQAGLDWLAGLSAYQTAIVAEDGRGFTSPGLPQVSPASAPATQCLGGPQP